VQIIVNCFTPYRGGFVMLQKPRRGWWVLPGGKVNPGELWPSAAKREMLEEAGLLVDNVVLRGVYLLYTPATNEQGTSTERLIAQFSATCVGGELLTECKEGKLDVVTADELVDLPMDEGDRMMVTRTFQSIEAGESRVYFGSFWYDANHQLLDWSLEPKA
jgi:8-oxo-dGTP diphosphatase